MSRPVANKAVLTGPFEFVSKRLVTAMRQLTTSQPLTTTPQRYISTNNRQYQPKQYGLIGKCEGNSHYGLKSNKMMQKMTKFQQKSPQHLSQRHFSDANKKQSTFTKVSSNDKASAVPPQATTPPPQANVKANTTTTTQSTNPVTPPKVEPVKPPQPTTPPQQQIKPIEPVKAEPKVEAKVEGKNTTTPTQQAVGAAAQNAAKAATTQAVNATDAKVTQVAAQNVTQKVTGTGSATTGAKTPPPPTSTIPPKVVRKTPFVPKIKTTFAIGLTVFVMYLLTDGFDMETINKLREGEKTFLIAQTTKAANRGVYLLKAGYNKVFGQLHEKALPPRPSTQQSLELSLPQQEVSQDVPNVLNITSSTSSTEQVSIPSSTTVSSTGIKGGMANLQDFGEKMGHIVENCKYYGNIGFAFAMNSINTISSKLQDYKQQLADKKQKELDQIEKVKKDEADKMRREGEERREKDRLRHERLQKEREERERIRKEEEEEKERLFREELAKTHVGDLTPTSVYTQQIEEEMAQIENNTTNNNNDDNVVDLDAKLEQLQGDRAHHYQWEQQQLQQAYAEKDAQEQQLQQQQLTQLESDRAHHYQWEQEQLNKAYEEQQQQQQNNNEQNQENINTIDDFVIIDPEVETIPVDVTVVVNEIIPLDGSEPIIIADIDIESDQDLPQTVINNIVEDINQDITKAIVIEEIEDAVEQVIYEEAVKDTFEEIIANPEFEEAIIQEAQSEAILNDIPIEVAIEHVINEIVIDKIAGDIANDVLVEEIAEIIIDNEHNQSQKEEKIENVENIEEITTPPTQPVPEFIEDSFVEEFLPYPELPEADVNLTSSRMLDVVRENDEKVQNHFLPNVVEAINSEMGLVDSITTTPQSKLEDPQGLVREGIYTERKLTKEELEEIQRRELEEEKLERERLFAYENRRATQIIHNGIIIDVEPDEIEWIPPPEMAKRKKKEEDEVLFLELSPQDKLAKITSFFQSYEARQEWQQARDTAAAQSNSVLTQAEREMGDLAVQLNDKLTSYQLSREDLIFDLHQKILNFDNTTEKSVILLELQDAEFFSDCRKLISAHTQSAVNAAIASSLVANEKQAVEYANRLETQTQNIFETLSTKFRTDSELAMTKFRQELEEDYQMDLFKVSLQHAKDIDQLQEKYLLVIDQINEKVKTLTEAITAQLNHQEQLEHVQKLTVALVEAERLLRRGESLQAPMDSLKEIAKYDPTLGHILSTIPQEVVDHGVAPVFHIQNAYKSCEGTAHRYAYLPPRDELLSHIAAFMLRTFTIESHELVAVQATTEADELSYPTSISRDVVNESFFKFIQADQARLRRAGYYFDRENLSQALEELKVIKNPHVRIKVQPIVVKVHERLQLDQTLQVLKAHGAALRKDIQRAQIADL